MNRLTLYNCRKCQVIDIQLLAWILTSSCTILDFRRDVDFATPSLKPDRLMIQTKPQLNRRVNALPHQGHRLRDSTKPSTELNNHILDSAQTACQRLCAWRETFRPRINSTGVKWSARTPFISDTRSLHPQVFYGHYPPRRLSLQRRVICFSLLWCENCKCKRQTYFGNI